MQMSLQHAVLLLYGGLHRRRYLHRYVDLILTQMDVLLRYVVLLRYAVLVRIFSRNTLFCSNP